MKTNYWGILDNISPNSPKNNSTVSMYNLCNYERIWCKFKNMHSAVLYYFVYVLIWTHSNNLQQMKCKGSQPWYLDLQSTLYHVSHDYDLTIHDNDVIAQTNYTKCWKKLFPVPPIPRTREHAMSSGSVQALTDTLLAAIDSEGNVSLFTWREMLNGDLQLSIDLTIFLNQEHLKFVITHYS